MRARRLPDDQLRQVRVAADTAADPIERAQAIRLGMEHWSALLQETVAAARDAGVPWEAIADALGISRQAATKRFRVDIVEDEESRENDE
jgi:hypothetical protein